MTLTVLIFTHRFVGYRVESALTLFLSFQCSSQEQKKGQLVERRLSHEDCGRRQHFCFTKIIIKSPTCKKWCYFILNTFLISSTDFILYYDRYHSLSNNNNIWKLFLFVLSFVHLQEWEASGGCDVISANDKVSMTTRGEPLTRVTWQNES